MSLLQPGESLRCPKCEETKGLWQAAVQSGWWPLNADGTADRRRWEKDCDGPEPDDFNPNYGCGECGFESASVKDLIVRLDRDGNPLPVVHPGQLSIGDVAA